MHSTTTELLHLSHCVLRGFDSGHLSAIVALDLTKAFATINHDLLLAKLRIYGLSPSAISLLCSFLSNRTQQVLIHNPFPLLSSPRQVISGVPQGSILGPLLFNIFVSDLTSISLSSQLFMYADDVIFLSFLHPSDALSASSSLNNDLAIVANWASSNGLCLNPSKSSLLIAGSPALLSRLHAFDIFLDLSSILHSSSIKLLGVHFDSSWSFKPHVTAKRRTFFSRLRLLYPFRHILSSSQKLVVSQSMIVSLFDYVNVVYALAFTQQLSERIQRVQNSCLRFSYGIRKFDHLTPLFNSSGWLKMRPRYILHLCCFIVSLLRSNSPPYLRRLLQLTSSSSILRHHQSPSILPHSSLL